MDRKLPDWLKESREAEKLIAWLKSPDCEVKEFSGQLFIKARYGNCFFFFDCLKENRKTDRNWCAVIHMPEYSLYEAEDLFVKRRVCSCTDDPGDQQGLYPAKCRPFY